MLEETFLPRLLFIKKKTFSPMVGALSTITVNKYGLVILIPGKSAKEKYLSYQRGSAKLIWAVTGVGAFSNAGQLLALGEEIHDSQNNRDDAINAKLKYLVPDLRVNDRCLILQAKNTGA